MIKYLAGALIALLTLSGISSSAKPLGEGDVKHVTLGEPVSDFSFIDAAGNVRKLSDYKGKIVVFEWTNPGCPFVQRVYSESIMQPLQSKYTEEGVVWIAVNSTNAGHRDYREGAEALKAYQEWKAGFSLLCLDSDGKIGRMFNAKTTPHMFIIDKSQKLVYNGAVDDDPRGTKNDKQNYVARALDEIIAGKEISTGTTTPYGCSVKYKQ
jgi:hypothetical protein